MRKIIVLMVIAMIMATVLTCLTPARDRKSRVNLLTRRVCASDHVYTETVTVGVRMITLYRCE